VRKCRASSSTAGAAAPAKSRHPTGWSSISIRTRSSASTWSGAAAFQLRRSFEALGLDSFALLSGGKGIHVVVPLAPEAEWDEVREFARSLCTALAQAAPDRFTVALPKPQRRGRIFLDFLRNQRTATAILPYSARARARMPVAAPVTWDELAEVGRADAFTIADAETLLERANSAELAGWGTGKQRLPRLAR
jgi:bifunctional non-homologous end joining protein LigD